MLSLQAYLYISAVKRIWHSVLLLVLVLVTTGTKANTIAIEHATHVEVSLLKSCSNKATLPDVLQVANHLPVAYRSSNFIINRIEAATLQHSILPCKVCNISVRLEHSLSSVPLHLAIRVLLI